MGNLLSLFSRRKIRDLHTDEAAELASVLSGYSIEVMPRTAAKVNDFSQLLPKGTRVYVAHIDGTPIESMMETVRRITDDGFPVMPHIPARSVVDKAMLNDWLMRYSDVGATQALVLAGGIDQPRGEFQSSMQLLESGLFDKHGFKRLHVAGHPEGNKDIDVDGSDKNVMEALRWKQEFSKRTDAEMAIVTQFAFETAPVIDWATRLANEGIFLPVHLGIAGPAKLQAMIKFAVACGVGPSIRVLQRRARDIGNLILPYEPTDVLAGIDAHKRACPQTLIQQVHFFPLGGVESTVRFTRDHTRMPSPGVRDRSHGLSC